MQEGRSEEHYKKEIVIRDLDENDDARISVKNITIFFMVTLIAAGISFLYHPVTAVGILFKVFISFCVIFNVMLSVFVLAYIAVIKIYSYFCRWL